MCRTTDFSFGTPIQVRLQANPVTPHCATHTLNHLTFSGVSGWTARQTKQEAVAGLETSASPYTSWNYPGLDPLPPREGDQQPFLAVAVFNQGSGQCGGDLVGPTVHFPDFLTSQTITDVHITLDWARSTVNDEEVRNRVQVIFVPFPPVPIGDGSCPEKHVLFELPPGRSTTTWVTKTESISTPLTDPFTGGDRRGAISGQPGQIVIRLPSASGANHYIAGIDNIRFTDPVGNPLELPTLPLHADQIAGKGRRDVAPGACNIHGDPVNTLTGSFLAASTHRTQPRCQPSHHPTARRRRMRT